MFDPTNVKDIAAVMLLAGHLFLGGAAYGQDRQTAGRFIDRFDQDRDGVVSREEYPGADEPFARLDADGDGTITALEVGNRSRRRGQSGGNFIQRFDGDGDGKVSADEFPGPGDRFAKLDADGDGYITESEAPAGQRKGGRRGRPPSGS